MISFAFGTEWGVGKPSDYDPCSSLPIHGEKKYVTVTVGGGGESKKIIDGQAAKDGDHRRRRNKAASTASLFKGATDVLGGFLPICMVLRPCGEDSKTYLKEMMFGLYSEPGITLVQLVPPLPPAQLKLNGLAFSSAGNLEMKEPDPPLWGYDNARGVPKNAHWWLQGTLEFPFGKIAEVSVQGTFGIFVEMGGTKDIAEFLSGLMDGGSVTSMAKYLVSSTYFFQLVAKAEATIALNVGGIFGKKYEGLGSFEVSVKASAVVEASADPGSSENTYLAQYFSMSQELDLTQFLTVTGFLADVFPLRKFNSDFGIFMKIRLNGEVDFGMHFKVTLTLDCDGFSKVRPFLPSSWKENMDILCGSPTQHFGVSVVARRNRFSMKDTCLTFANKKICLDVLPTCPPPVSVGEKCSLNSDCQGDEYNGGQGYCKSENSLKTTVFCTGKCVQKALPGQSCSAGSTNTWNLATSAENPFCTSDGCLCSTCVELHSKKLRDGKKCATNDNCQSGFCDKGSVLATAAGQGCTGTCRAKKAWGASCHFDDACQTGHCNAGCRSLFNCVSDGKCADCLDDGHCGWNRYCDNYRCYNKKNDGDSTDHNRKCKSNRDVCGVCANSHGRVPNGKKCSLDSDCQNDSCGSWWSTCYGCNCHCD